MSETPTQSSRSYDIDAMRAAIKKCDENIRTFEQAIEMEQATKRDYARIVRELEAKADGANG